MTTVANNLLDKKPNGCNDTIENGLSHRKTSGLSPMDTNIPPNNLLVTGGEFNIVNGNVIHNSGGRSGTIGGFNFTPWLYLQTEGLIP